MQEKKALDITLINLTGLKNSIADYFVICSGNSDTHLDAIATSVEEIVFKQSGQEPWQKEGLQNKEWVLLDYVDVVVHIMKKDKREFYSLEELWGDAEIIKLENAETSSSEFRS